MAPQALYLYLLIVYDAYKVIHCLRVHAVTRTLRDFLPLALCVILRPRHLLTLRVGFLPAWGFLVSPGANGPGGTLHQPLDIWLGQGFSYLLRVDYSPLQLLEPFPDVGYPLFNG